MKISCFFFAVLLIGLSLGACGDSKDPVSDAASAKGDVVQRGVGGDPGSLDPARAEDIHSFEVLVDLYEGLVTHSADGKLIPGVASSWTVSDDGLTYLFALRNDARWSDGRPVEAVDFVNAFRRVADPNTLSSYAFLLEDLENFDAIQNGELAATALGVKALTARKLEVRLSAPTAHILSILAMPIAFPVPTANPAAGHFSDVSKFVGNGAFVLKDRQIGGPIRLERSETYWDAASVAVDVVEYWALTDPMAELNRFRSGELHITSTIPKEMFPTLIEKSPDEVKIGPALALYYMAFDLSEEPFDNPELRKALSLAIDRERLVEIIGRGEQAAYGVVPPNIDGHRPARYDWQEMPQEAREAAARAAYRAAGYSAERPLSFKLTYDVGDIHEDVALAVSAMWQDVLDVEIEYDKKEWMYFLSTRDNRPAWQIMRFAWFGDYSDASTFLNIFHSGSPQNLPQYVSRSYDALLEEASATRLAAARAELMHTAESMLLQDYPIVPLYFFVNKHMVSASISGFENNALDRHPSRFLKLERVQP